MKELTKEMIKNIAVGYMLPQPYRDYADDKGIMNWEALEMCYPGRSDVLITILAEMLGGDIAGTISWKVAVATGEIDLSSLKGPTGPTGPQGPRGI